MAYKIVGVNNPKNKEESKKVTKVRKLSEKLIKLEGSEYIKGASIYVAISMFFKMLQTNPGLDYDDISCIILMTAGIIGAAVSSNYTKKRRNEIVSDYEKTLDEADIAKRVRRLNNEK